MRSADGGWLKAPPPWACIGAGHNLDEFIDVENSQHATAVGLGSLQASEFLEDCRVAGTTGNGGPGGTRPCRLLAGALDSARSVQANLARRMLKTRCLASSFELAFLQQRRLLVLVARNHFSWHGFRAPSPSPLQLAKPHQVQMSVQLPESTYAYSLPTGFSRSTGTAYILNIPLR